MKPDKEYQELQRESYEADAWYEMEDQRQAGIDAILEDCGLGVIEPVDGPGYYVGQIDDPENQVWFMHEKEAYDELKCQQDEYLDDM